MRHSTIRGGQRTQQRSLIAPAVVILSEPVCEPIANAVVVTELLFAPGRQADGTASASRERGLVASVRERVRGCQPGLLQVPTDSS